MAKLARLKPYNPRRGHVVQRLHFGGVKFLVERGWYQVSDGLATMLKTLRQDMNDLDSPPAFDVLTQGEAEEIEDIERLAEEKRARASEPISTAIDVTDMGGDLTTESLPKAKPRSSGRKPRKKPAKPKAKTK